jgi:hypothetical protein
MCGKYLHKTKYNVERIRLVNNKGLPTQDTQIQPVICLHILEQCVWVQMPRNTTWHPSEWRGQTLSLCCQRRANRSDMTRRGTVQSLSSTHLPRCCTIEFGDLRFANCYVQKPRNFDVITDCKWHNLAASGANSLILMNLNRENCRRSTEENQENPYRHGRAQDLVASSPENERKQKCPEVSLPIRTGQHAPGLELRFSLSWQKSEGLLGCNIVYLWETLTFREKISSPSSVSKINPSKKPT